MDISCPNCKAASMDPFYEVENVPVHSVLLMDSKQEALQYPKRNITLGFCSHCGFISNTVFDHNVHEYSSKYEETQGFSGTFNQFHYELAEGLIKKYKLYNKTVLEIGCGKGDFITLLSEIGNNKGYGFDPAFIPERNPDKNNRVEFITDFYSEKYSGYKADFICCKMTLEHIPNTFDFVKMVRNAIGENFDTVIFFQVPETSRILNDLGFWDIYYEHCSYFSKASLAYLFEAAGFEILDIETAYDNQYLMIDAKPAKHTHFNDHTSYLKEIKNDVASFRNNILNYLDLWKKMLREDINDGLTTVLWGGGSKAVAFLTTLGIEEEIRYAVDINPYKHGTYLAGSGQEVIAPEKLKELKPDKIIVMNPVYVNEILSELEQMDLEPEVISIDFMNKNLPRKEMISYRE